MRMNMMMMMMEVEQEEAEEEEIEHVFIAHEIDLDYEFDAPRFFDFTRPETHAEAHRAELWFQNAPTYPPSPFVMKLVGREGFLLNNACNSPKSKHLEFTSNVDDEKPSVTSGVRLSRMVFDDNGSKAFGGSGILQNDATSTLQLPTGLTFSSKTTSDTLTAKGKCAVPKSSTLMKPTASQLAKQNRPFQNVGSRFQKLQTQNERNLSTSSGLESQAPKRQKLEGGVLCKVTDVKQQTNFFHKAPKVTVTVEQKTAHSKLKLTIPREPDLKTAHRAQRIRPRNVAEAENVTVGAPKFKARPLNRKMLDAPLLPLLKRSNPQLPEFQEFHLKTSERAMQHTSATSSSSLHCNDSDKGLEKHTAVTALEKRMRDWRRPAAMGTPKFDALCFIHNSKARLAKHHNVYAEKGVEYNPPVELFSKLSLTSEVQPNNGSHFKLPQHSGICRKEKPFTFGSKQLHSGNSGCISEASTMLGARRSLGIR